MQGTELFAYIMDVLFPESIVLVLMDVESIPYKEVRLPCACMHGVCMYITLYNVD